MSIQKAFLIAALLIAGSTVPITHSQAASTALGPTVCVRAGTVGAAGNGLTYDSVGVTNISGAPAEVLCSLFRDNTSNSNGMQDLELSVKDPTSGSVICDAQSLDRKGVIKKQVRKQTSVTGESVLDWGSGVNVSVSKGFYVIRCTIPNGATIRSIYYVEP
jgi:hypothetical protein